MTKLAIAQMVLGVLVVASRFLMAWALWSSPVVDWGVLPDPLQLVLGILVFACGLAQYLKARRG